MNRHGTLDLSGVSETPRAVAPSFRVHERAEGWVAFSLHDCMTASEMHPWRRARRGSRFLRATALQWIDAPLGGKRGRGSGNNDGAAAIGQPRGLGRGGPPTSATANGATPGPIATVAAAAGGRSAIQIRAGISAGSRPRPQAIPAPLILAWARVLRSVLGLAEWSRPDAGRAGVVGCGR